MGSLPTHPFDSDRAIGTVIEIGPTYVKANLPRASTATGEWIHGYRIGNGEVGEFVFIESTVDAILGRITSVRLPERERLTVEPGVGASKESHPVGNIQLLSTVSLSSGNVVGGISQYPRIGSRVYSADPDLIRWIAEESSPSHCGGDEIKIKIDLARLTVSDNVSVGFSPERLFGRHCAVLGATGGGKSWTLARLIEQAAKFKSKLILFDATGEYYRLDTKCRHVYIGAGTPAPPSATEVTLPYSEMTEVDLFAFFKPSGQAQGPKLRLAIKSLKFTRIVGAGGCYIKAGQPRGPFEDQYRAHIAEIDQPKATLNIRHLARQVNEECVWLTDRKDPDKWGDYNENEKGYCSGLITRITDIVKSSDLSCVFDPGGKPSLLQTLADFLDDPKHSVLRVSLRHIPFGHDTRDIVMNAVGRHVLQMAREGLFRSKPVILFIDEAHQFLSKTIGDEFNRYPLDSFELIAKEGRKYGLTLCLATQRPRDIPDAVLSQMGTLVVHRLINDRDRETVERASGDLDRSAAAFLPTLAPGEAAIIGVDFPIPLTVLIAPPAAEPDSQGPNYQVHWHN
jgi:DNA helicase HerA-like ATPase